MGIAVLIGIMALLALRINPLFRWLAYPLAVLFIICGVAGEHILGLAGLGLFAVTLAMGKLQSRALDRAEANGICTTCNNTRKVSDPFARRFKPCPSCSGGSWA
jgi:hypothetical protein